MANFPRVNLAGWAANEVLTSSQMNALDIAHTKAPNFAEGSDHTPTAPVYCRGGQGLYCETFSVDGTMTTHSGTTVFLDTTEVEFYGSSLCTFDDGAHLSFLDGSEIGLADGCVFLSAATLNFAAMGDLAPCVDSLTAPTTNHRKEIIRAKLATNHCGHLLAANTGIPAMELTANAAVDETTGDYAKDANDTAGKVQIDKNGLLTVSRKGTGSTDFTSFDDEIFIQPNAAATPTLNTLSPNNITKAWAYLRTNGSGGVVIEKNYGVASAALNGTNDGILITLDVPFTDTEVCITVTDSTNDSNFRIPKAYATEVDEIEIKLGDPATGLPLELDAVTRYISVHVHGYQS